MNWISKYYKHLFERHCDKKKKDKPAEQITDEGLVPGI